MQIHLILPPPNAEAFVEPFNQLLLLEEDEDGDQSPWLDTGINKVAYFDQV